MKKFLHNKLGWGFPKGSIESSDLPGAAGEAVCECGKPIIKDRGGWYHPYESHIDVVVKDISKL